MSAVLIVALGGLVGFMGVVVAQHLLVTELAPDRHFVSEYANTEAGYLMTAGFLMWAASLAATAASARLFDRGAARTVLVALLSVSVAGMILTASFETQTVAGELPAGETLETKGRLHDLGSGAAQLALFGAALASTRVSPTPRWFRRGVLALLVTAIAMSAILLEVGDEVGGLRQRMLLAIACLWQAWLLGTSRRAST